MLDNFNYKFESSKINFIIGANGTGKSTLISCILEFLSYNGTIIHNIKNISYQPEKVLLPDLIKVYDYLKIINKIVLNKGCDKIDYFLKIFNIEDAMNKELITLSKGMRQKVWLIQTLIKEADGYIFDEPLSGLDILTQQIFFEELKKLLEQDKLIIIITHFLDQYPLDNYLVVDLNNKTRYQQND